jgi:hypothetical protein
MTASRARPREGFRNVTGYWLGDGARFGASDSSVSVDVPGLPRTAPVHSAKTDCGISLVTTHHGLVVADFSDWPTESEPCPDEVLDRSPFAPNRLLAERVFRLGRRVTVLNAHQACLLAVLGIESDEDYYSPDPRPVTPETAWVGWADEDVSIPTSELAGYIAAFDESGPWSIFPPNYPVQRVDAAFENFNLVANAGPVALRAADLLLHATWHYGAHRFDQSLLCAFPAAEAVLRGLWQRHIDANVAMREEGDYRMTADKRRILHGSEFTFNVLLETLALHGAVGDVEYRKARRAASARNRVMHRIEPVAGRDAGDAIEVALTLLRDYSGAVIDLTYGLTGHGL